MAGVPERECCLKNVLDEINEDYDFVVIDCPPAVGLLTFNALRAATDVLVPVETGYFALHGLSKQLETLSILCKRCKQQVNVRVLASMYDIRTKMAREILAELRTHFSDRMLKTVVNFNTKIKEAASFGQPINEYDPASKGQQDFQTLAEEIIGVESQVESRQLVNTLADQLETISTTANELLESSKSRRQELPVPIKTVPGRSDHKPVPVQPAMVGAPSKEQEQQPLSTAGEEKPMDTEAKLSDYYGVNQISDAVVFVSLYPRAKGVQIAGDFNNWKPDNNPMERVGDSGVWQTKIPLPQGQYRYRLVVDGRWQQDPYNEWTELNPFGEYNSVLEVK
jgi:chromosome partitioning protein